MAATYSSFLQSPSTSQLASDATLHYVTTTTSINEPTAILKHLQTQLKQVAKKEERVLNAIEGPDSLFLETETTLQFNNGGGAYLPSMDDNLLDEKLVTFPLLHVVMFDGDQKIKQIRLHWDQSTLLKQVEAIGRTGRNWPIRDGKAQVDTIVKSLKASGIEPSSNKTPLGARNPNEVVINQHKRGDSVSATRDPHASLALFAARDTNADAAAPYEGPKVATRPSAKPAPRNYDEMFAGEKSPAAGSKVRSSSPTKVEGAVFKSGAGKHYAGNRLFDENDQPGVARSPERKKTYDQKYQHFAFGDGEEAPERKRPTSSRSKAQPTFSFEDFATPPKYQAKARPDDEVHWGADDPPSPPKRPIVHAARKDADPHFQFTDASSPAHSQPKTLQHNKGTNLYHDSVAEDDTEPTKRSSRTTAATHVENARRGNDFGAHYSMTDSPAQQQENGRPTSRGQRSDMDQHWSYGTTPQERKVYKTAGDGMGGRKGASNIIGEPTEKAIYKTAGDGMGGRRAGGGRGWGFGDDSDIEDDGANVRNSTRGRRAQAQAGASAAFNVGEE